MAFGLWLAASLTGQLPLTQGIVFGATMLRAALRFMGRVPSNATDTRTSARTYMHPRIHWANKHSGCVGRGCNGSRRSRLLVPNGPWQQENDAILCFVRYMPRPEHKTHRMLASQTCLPVRRAGPVVAHYRAVEFKYKLGLGADTLEGEEVREGGVCVVCCVLCVCVFACCVLCVS